MNLLLMSFLTMFNMACTDDNSSNLDIIASDYAVVQKVSVSGNEGNYTFSVTLKSPDKGCAQYANWWEVISENEELIYRRILAHSHVSEQPFSRSGGSVKINATDVVIVRGHMNTNGYGEGEISLIGSVDAGFGPFDLAKGFGLVLENEAPLPTGCAF